MTADPKKTARLLELKKLLGNEFPKIGVLVVSYHASSRLVETLNRIPATLLGVLEEVVVFDDFSQDDTFELAQELAKNPLWKNTLRAYRNPRNLGYGGNQKVGFNYAMEKHFDYVVLLHGDGRYPPELLPDFLYEAIERRKNVVLGSRMMHPWSALKSSMPLYKWIGNLVLTTFENGVLGLRLTEFHSGYRLYGTSVLRQLPYGANTDGFHFDTQIIVQCRALGEPISEIPIPAYDGEEIRFSNGLRYAWNVCLSVIRYRLHQTRIVHDNRYDVGSGVRYQLKSSPYSSHSQILDLVPHGAVVLDIGCGPGLLARKLGEKGAQTDGIDANNPDAVWTGIESYRQADLEKTGDLAFERKYDCIILADVLEHLRNPNDLLRSIRATLKAKGKLIASTPNIALWYMRLSLLLGRFNYGDRGILDRTHVHLYTMATFEKLLLESGFRVTGRRTTSLPFELVFQSTGKSVLVRSLDWIYHTLTRLWPTLFAYQFVLEAELTQLESAQGEGKLL